MEGALLADGVPQQQVKDRLGVVAQRAVTVDCRAGAELILVADGAFCLLAGPPHPLR